MRTKITYNAPVILTFVFVCFAVMVLNILTGGTSNRILFVTRHSSLLSPLTYIRFFTHVLGHVSWSHYIGNMMMLLLLGPMLEEKYGSRTILEVMALTAFTTGVATWILFPNVALCGASGIVFAFIMMTSYTSFKENEVPLTVILVAITYIGQQVYGGLFVHDNVSHMGHIIGGIVGAIAGYVLNINNEKDIPRHQKKSYFLF